MACVIAGCDYSESVGCACIFIYGLFNDGLSKSDYVALNDRMVVNNGLERVLKKWLSYDLRPLRKCIWNRSCSARDLNWASSECKSEALPLD